MSQPPPTPGSLEEDDPYSDDADEGQTARMSFLDHLDELRRRLVVSVVSILVGFLVAFAFIERIFGFVMRPLQAVLPNGGKLVYTEPAEAFLLYMKIAFLVGLFIALPVILYELWMFIAPGLYSHEKKFAIPFVVFATLFFVSGAAFSHYMVFPWAWAFFAGFTTDYMAFMPKIDAVFSLYVRMLLAMGVVFQLPTLVFFLARMGLVTPRFMIKNTKYAILIIFIIAAVLTPSPDVITQVLMAAPMMVLYALSIAIAWAFQKRKTTDTEA